MQIDPPNNFENDSRMKQLVRQLGAAERLLEKAQKTGHQKRILSAMIKCSNLKNAIAAYAKENN